MSKLFKPFEYIAGQAALIIGLLISFQSIGLGMWKGIRFDGILDVHLGAIRPWYHYTLDQVINIGVLVLLFLILGKILKVSARFIDVAGTIMMARIPVFILGLIVLGLPLDEMKSLEQNISTTVDFVQEHAFLFTVGGLVGVIFFVYYIQLLWQAFKTCFNKTDAKSIVLFIAGLLLAELISKLLIMFAVPA